MKKIIMSFVLLLVGMAVSAQTVDKLIAKYKDMPNAEFIHINRTMMKLVMLGSKTLSIHGNNISISDGVKINSINVLTLDDCSEVVRKDFVTDFSAMDFENQGYDLLVKTTDDGEKISIYAKKNENICKELIIFASDCGELNLVQFFGKFDLDKIKE